MFVCVMGAGLPASTFPLCSPGPWYEQGAAAPQVPQAERLGRCSPAFFWRPKPEPSQVTQPPQQGRARPGTVGQALMSSLHVVAQTYFCLVWLILAGCSRPIMPCFSTRLFRPRNVLFVPQAENTKPPLWLVALRFEQSLIYLGFS